MKLRSLKLERFGHFQGATLEFSEGLQLLSCPTLMEGSDGRRALAERVLEFARMLA